MADGAGRGAASPPTEEAGPTRDGATAVGPKPDGLLARAVETLRHGLAAAGADPKRLRVLSGRATRLRLTLAVTVTPASDPASGATEGSGGDDAELLAAPVARVRADPAGALARPEPGSALAATVTAVDPAPPDLTDLPPARLLALAAVRPLPPVPGDGPGTVRFGLTVPLVRLRLGWAGQEGEALFAGTTATPLSRPGFLPAETPRPTIPDLAARIAANQPVPPALSREVLARAAAAEPGLAVLLRGYLALRPETLPDGVAPPDPDLADQAIAVAVHGLASWIAAWRWGPFLLLMLPVLALLWWRPWDEALVTGLMAALDASRGAAEALAGALHWLLILPIVLAAGEATDRVAVRRFRRVVPDAKSLPLMGPRLILGWAAATGAALSVALSSGPDGQARRIGEGLLAELATLQSRYAAGLVEGYAPTLRAMNPSAGWAAEALGTNGARVSRPLTPVECRGVELMTDEALALGARIAAGPAGCGGEARLTAPLLAATQP